MNWWRGIAVLLLAGLLYGAVPPDARADEWNKKTIITFKEPVELPGIVLQPGTYMFKLMDSESDRNIVQVLNQDETHLYATILAIPDYRLEPTDKSVLRFEERPKNSPPAIKEWFYPGDLYGQEFVYPKSRAVEIAKATNQNVLSMPTELGPNITTPAKSPKEAHVAAMRNAPVKAVKPSGEEVAAEAAVTTHPTAAMKTMQAKSAGGHLPKTASSLPLLGLIALCLLGAGAGLRVLSKRLA